MIYRRFFAVFAWVVLAASVASLIGVGAAYAAKLSGKVSLDGSSTVFPISEAVAEEFQAVHNGVKVTVASPALAEVSRSPA